MVSSWEPSHIDKTFFPTSTDTTDTEKAMLEELATRKYNWVYESVDYNNQELIISLGWVHSSKVANSNKKTKAWLVAKGYHKENNIKSNSPTCNKESLRRILKIPAMNGRYNPLISNQALCRVIPLIQRSLWNHLKKLMKVQIKYGN